MEPSPSLLVFHLLKLKVLNFSFLCSMFSVTLIWKARISHQCVSFLQYHCFSPSNRKPMKQMNSVQRPRNTFLTWKCRRSTQNSCCGKSQFCNSLQTQIDLNSGGEHGTVCIHFVGQLMSARGTEVTSNWQGIWFYPSLHIRHFISCGLASATVVSVSKWSYIMPPSIRGRQET